MKIAKRNVSFKNYEENALCLTNERERKENIVWSADFYALICACSCRLDQLLTFIHHQK